MYLTIQGRRCFAAEAKPAVQQDNHIHLVIRRIQETVILQGQLSLLGAIVEKVTDDDFHTHVQIWSLLPTCQAGGYDEEVALSVNHGMDITVFSDLCQSPGTYRYRVTHRKHRD